MYVHTVDPPPPPPAPLAVKAARQKIDWPWPVFWGYCMAVWSDMVYTALSLSEPF